jgi:cytochrome P450
MSIAEYRSKPGAAAASLAEPAPPSSPAGPVDEALPVRMPPGRPFGRFAQSMRFVADPLGSNLAARRDFGDVWQLHLMSRRDPFVVTCHPDHVRSLFTSAPDDAPSLTGESPLRPILGPSSVLTAVGARHMRQRKLLLPPFHGEAVQRYVEMIEAVAEREIDSWRLSTEFALAPRMQAVTLDVIMGGVFGIVGTPRRGSSEFRLREGIRRMLAASTKPLYQLIELRNAGRREPRGILRAALALVDRHVYALIRARRSSGSDADRHDVLSLLLEARDEDGVALTDRELRDELMTLVLAGHETTANSLAWTFERLLRTPAAYDRLREETRAGDDTYLEATITEAMRNRPVIPMVVRMANRRWQLGDYVIPARTPVAISIAALHHREDVYPDPLVFRPERFLARKPGRYSWIPFGGGIRRCLGATLAMAEQRVVLRAIAIRTDLAAPDPSPERARQRNVTMIPHRGGRIVVVSKHRA